MATSHSLKAETRACGSGNLKQLRSQGLVPGVVYGPGFDNVNIQAVTDTTVIHSIVPVILEGEAAGVALGGVLDQTIHELAIVCQVKNLPEAITADISGLKLGETLRIADLKLPSGVNTELAGDVIVAIVEAPRVSSEEAAPAAEEAVAEK